MLWTLATSRPVELALTEEEFESYHQQLTGTTAVDGSVNLRIARWTDWIEHIDACDINLMSDFVRNKTWVFDARRWRAAAVFAIATGVVNIAAFNWDWWRLYREGHRLQQEMQSVYSTVFHDAPISFPSCFHGRWMHIKLALLWVKHSHICTAFFMPANFYAL